VQILCKLNVWPGFVQKLCKFGGRNPRRNVKYLAPAGLFGASGGDWARVIRVRRLLWKSPKREALATYPLDSCDSFLQNVGIDAGMIRPKPFAERVKNIVSATPIRIYIVTRAFWPPISETQRAVWKKIPNPVINTSLERQGFFLPGFNCFNFFTAASKSFSTGDGFASSSTRNFENSNSAFATAASCDIFPA
jgi:hypothetical protein